MVRSIYGVGVIVALSVAILTSFVLFQTMYAPVFPGYYYPPRRPHEDDIIGTWIPTPNTLALMEEFGYTTITHSIKFSKEGEFQMTNMPSLFLFKNDREFYSGSGTWSVDRDRQDYWVIKVIFTSMTPAYSPNPPQSQPTPCPGQSVPCGGLERHFDLWNRKPPYILIVNILGGELDPDLYFTRTIDVHD